MKVYQENWLNKLEGTNQTKDVVRVCTAITKDDTGGTCSLTKELAKKYLELNEKFAKLKNKHKDNVEFLYGNN